MFGFDGFEFRHAFVDDYDSVSCVMEIKVGFDHIVQLFVQLNQIYFPRRQDYCRRPTCFPGTASYLVASATAASASISVVLKGAKNFWVANSLGA
jgi:hypothetical protein